MQISASLHSYENAPRSLIYDRKPVTIEPTDDPAYSLRDDAMTGSQTVLSSSLAEALWAIQRTSGEIERGSASAIESAYLSYSE
jgi:hypothetical protein